MNDRAPTEVNDRAQIDERFARHTRLGGWRQETLTDATAVICGMGALGNEVAKNLGLAGIGHLILCDPDTVERTNLARTVLFRDPDVGRPKVQVAAEALAGLAPQTAVETRTDALTAGVGLAELRDARIVLGCLDSRHARLELLARAGLADAALIDGGTGPWSGEVRVRVAADEPCYGCTLTASERAIGDLPTAYTDLYPDGDLSASIALTALIGAWMATTALRIIFDQTPNYRMLRIEGLDGTTRPIDLARDANCPHHHPLGPVDFHVPVSHDDTVGNLLDSLPPRYCVETWTAFPVGTICRPCGARTDYHRALNVRQGGRCVECGGPIRPILSQSLFDTSRSSRLSDLGVAPREILPARDADGMIRLVELCPRP